MLSETEAPVVVEKTALQTLDDEPVVFVKEGEGFIPQTVKVGKENDDNVEILSGLKCRSAICIQRSIHTKSRNC